MDIKKEYQKTKLPFFTAVWINFSSSYAQSIYFILLGVFLLPTFFQKATPPTGAQIVVDYLYSFFFFFFILYVITLVVTYIHRMKKVHPQTIVFSKDDIVMKFESGGQVKLIIKDMYSVAETKEYLAFIFNLPIKAVVPVSKKVFSEKELEYLKNAWLENDKKVIKPFALILQTGAKAALVVTLIAAVYELLLMLFF